jgi:surfactin synthase thioesterase subunit
MQEDGSEKEAWMEGPRRSQVAQVWRDVLERDVGSEDAGFHALGGNSLKALRICARLSEILGCKVPVRTLLEHHVFGDFCAAVDRLVAAEQRSAPLPVVFLPFAGSGASFYRAWADVAPEGTEVFAVQLPGREEVFHEPLYTDVPSAVPELTEQIVQAMKGRPPFALFGHSLGAVLAYEIARQLHASADSPVRHLFVSGSPGPWSGRREEDRASVLADEEFLAQVSELAGFQHEALADPDMREVLLPRLRADVAMHENYAAADHEPLDLPVTALRGQDDLLVSPAATQEWSAVTRGPFGVRELPGGHMYLVDRAREVLDTISEVGRR